MLLYTMIMVAAGISFVWLGSRISRGEISLIHDYHRQNVKEEEKAAYGKAFSKGMFGMAASMNGSGVAALFGDSRPVMITSLAILFLGFAVSIAVLLRAQKKYNGGLF